MGGYPRLVYFVPARPLRPQGVNMYSILKFYLARDTSLDTCVCDGWTPQNAAHLLGCPWVGDDRGRTSEQVLEDERWCEAVAEFIM